MTRHEVLSPIPGVFYRKPDPDSPDYVKPGQHVSAGDTVGLVEVMKSFYPVEAGAEGTVVDFAAEGESVVEAGQVLVVLEVES
ncbi:MULTISPECIES: acetyl-CoA carboxylase [Amycolatopsis]|uniref:Biotin carboxyl carrier protein of acetyl-CoA carboxylase n=1 Tax=Amycolatopsis thermoflava TaxID=84480 RepID=A0A3N2H577_9PSEU|nr:acetyl-CoA carboxylase [Amycolatopsis thermoflava]ROS44068.1 biotin-dependent enzyme [Amycolatopsis thermoflava]